jgi:hypothetical protein
LRLARIAVLVGYLMNEYVPLLTIILLLAVVIYNIAQHTPCSTLLRSTLRWTEKLQYFVNSAWGTHHPNFTTWAPISSEQGGGIVANTLTGNWQMWLQ